MFREIKRKHMNKIVPKFGEFLKKRKRKNSVLLCKYFFLI